MLNQWLSVIWQTAPGPIMGYAFELMMEVKQGKIRRWMRIAFWTLNVFLIAVHKVFYYGNVQTAWINWAIMPIFMMFSFVMFYEGNFWKKTVIYLTLLGAIMIAECAFVVVCWLYQVKGLSMDFSQTDMMVGSFLGNLMSVIAIFATVILWRRFNKKSPLPRSSWVFVLMALCLGIPYFYYYGEMVQGSGRVSFIHLISMAASFVMNLVMICVQFNQAEKDGLHKELEELKYKSRLEQQNYKIIEVRRKEMEGIRREYNQLLLSAKELLHTGKIEEAEQMLTSLFERVSATREYQYCGIPIVNVILSEKQGECEKNGIALLTDLVFPENVTVEQIDLCRVFGNLLDNAIRACRQLPSDMERKITLNVRMQGDYLIIRCENPAIKASGEYPEGTGYGSKILKDIARRYEGQFFSEFREGIFTARLVLLTQSQYN
ncbi:MAG: sensor histidine kinase [Oliverpabstia sp.]